MFKMKIGIIGLPGSGKSSLFKALVGERIKPEPHERFLLQWGSIKLEDSRLRHLAEVLGSKKITFVEIQLLDLVLHRATEKVWLEASVLREVDSFVGTLRWFRDPAVRAYQDKIEPLHDVKIMENELILRDLESVENRLHKIKEEIKKGKKEEEKELALLERINQYLQQETALRKINLDPQEEKWLRGFKFLSQKPIFFILNLDEDMIWEGLDNLKENLTQQGHNFITASLKLEAELNQLEPKDQLAFLESLGFKEPLGKRFLGACLEFLDLVSFFTVKGEEAKAHLIDKNTPALKAAGKVHSDMERGFIRAEVVNYNDLVNSGSSFAEARKKGLVHLESKDYIVKDGDIIDFRFAV